MITDDRAGRPWTIAAGLDMALCPRPAECRPAALLPALWVLAAGRPVITDDPALIRRLPGTGWSGPIVVAGRGALSGQLLRLVDDRDEAARRGAAGQRLVEQRLPIQGTAEALSAIYRKLVPERGD
jgi:glycosyltransferase involved in cell wall biosynthesis